MLKKRIMRRLYIGDKLQNLYLTPREKQCISHLLDYHTMKETGELLGISKRTVEAHISRAKMRLKCKDSRELLRIVANHGITISKK